MAGSILADLGRQLGADRPEDLASRADLTFAYSRAGWSAQEVALHERTLADRERLLGPDHPHTLASRADLAYAYCQAGWLAQAIPLYERTFADWKRLLGSDHSRTLRSSNYLAGAYREAGRLAEAIPLYERTLADRRRLLGSDHPSTLRSSNYLAGAYREAGRLAEAIPLYERTLARCTRVLGNNHTLTRTVRRDLSVTQELTEADDSTVVGGLPPVRPTMRAAGAHRARWPVILVLVCAILAVAGIVIFRVGTGSGHSAATKPAVTHRVTAHRPTRAGAPSHPAPTTAPGAAASASPTAAAQVLVPVSASAFGPGGYGSGDNPQQASMAIDANTATAWTTDWYGAAQFGNVQAGTGLLIDMGHPERITSLQIILGSARGADLQVLTGNVPARAKLQLEASASDAGGTLQLTMARPAQVRYLLIWFTLLPPDSSGTFQANIYNVRLEGTP